MELPDRTAAAEDQFVGDLASSEDVDELIASIEAAMAGRRPQLAARLVGLLDGKVEIEPGSDLARAQAAARLLLFDKARPVDLSFSELEEAWGLARSRRMKRIKLRMRASLSGDGARFGRLGNRRR